MAVDGNGTLFLAVSHANSIATVNANGVLTWIAGTCAPAKVPVVGTDTNLLSFNGIAVTENGDIYVSVSETRKNSVLYVMSAVYLIRGRKTIARFGTPFKERQMIGSKEEKAVRKDGYGAEMAFVLPGGLCVDKDGRSVLVADWDSVRVIQQDGFVRTVALFGGVITSVTEICVVGDNVYVASCITGAIARLSNGICTYLADVKYVAMTQYYGKLYVFSKSGTIQVFNNDVLETEYQPCIIVLGARHTDGYNDIVARHGVIHIIDGARALYKGALARRWIPSTHGETRTSFKDAVKTVALMRSRNGTVWHGMPADTMYEILDFLIQNY